MARTKTSNAKASFLSWFSKEQSRTTSAKARKRAPGALQLLAARWSLRLFLLLVLFWIIAWIVFSGWPQQVYKAAETYIIERTVEAGFTIKEIDIEGVKETIPEAVSALKAKWTGKPSLALPLADIENAFENLAWIKEAQVIRVWPDRLRVIVTEYEPVVIWQDGETLRLIDDQAHVIINDKLAGFEDLLIVSGRNAQTHAGALVEVLEAFPDIYGALRGAVFQGERRWDLLLESGAVIKCPEENLREALARLQKIHENKSLLHQPLIEVDLRHPERVIVRVPSGEVMNFQAQVLGRSDGSII